jgi:hypothetical protein
VSVQLSVRTWLEIVRISQMVLLVLREYDVYPEVIRVSEFSICEEWLNTLEVCRLKIMLTF